MLLHGIVYWFASAAHASAAAETTVRTDVNACSSGEIVVDERGMVLQLDLRSSDLPALLWITETGQDVVVDGGDVRSIGAPPRLGFWFTPVRSASELEIRLVRPEATPSRIGFRCEPYSEGAWRWLEGLSAVAAKFGGHVGAVKEELAADQASTLETSAPNATLAALAVHIEAQALLISGQSAAAVRAFAEAEETWRGLGDRARAAAARTARLEDLNRIGEYAQVISATTAQLGAADAESYFGVRAHNARCVALMYLGQLESASGCLAQVVAAYDAINEPLEMASAALDFGAVEVKQKRYDSALNMLTQALELAQGANSSEVQGRVYYRLADLWSIQGEFGRAIENLQLASDRFASASSTRWQASTLLKLSRMLAQLGAFADAQSAAQEAMSYLDLENAPARVAVANTDLARIALSTGDYEQALFEVEQAIAHFHRLKMPAPLGTAQALRVRLLIESGQPQRALLAALARSQHALPDHAGDAVNMAALALISGAHHVAEHYIESASNSALPWNERVRLMVLEAELIAAKQGADDGLAFLANRRLQSNMLLDQVGNRSLVQALRASLVTLRLAAVDMIATELGTSGVSESPAAINAALNWLEVDIGIGLSDSADAQKARQASETVGALVLKNLNGASDVRASSLTLLNLLTSADISKAAQSTDAIITLNGLRSTLSSDDLLLAVLAGKREGILVWVGVETGGLARIPGFSAVRSKVAELQAKLKDRESDVHEIASVSSHLQARIFPRHLATGTFERWLVVNQDLGGEIPWTLIRRNAKGESDATVSLIEFHTTAEAATPYPNVPEEISVFVAAQSDSKSPLATLTGASAETRLIAESIPALPVRTGVLRDRDTLFATLGRSRSWVHIAAHGTLAPGRFAGSGLWLDLASNSPPAYVSSIEVLRTPVRSELVVLNACQLAATESQSTRAVTTMANALIGAGARHVIAARWQVSDSATSIWVPAFYRSAARWTDRPDIALLSAQQSLLRTRAYRHPHHWASWVHVQRWPARAETPH